MALPILLNSRECDRSNVGTPPYGEFYNYLAFFWIILVRGLIHILLTRLMRLFRSMALSFLDGIGLLRFCQHVSSFYTISSLGLA